MYNDIRDALVAEAREWIGTPWVPFGRRKGVEADCIFLEEVGRVVVGFRGKHHGYSMLPKDGHLQRYADAELKTILERQFDRREVADVPIDELLPGDLALFRGRNPHEPQHFGMIAIHPSRALDHVRTLIHAGGDRQRGRVMEHSFSNSKTWMRRLWKIYRFPGVK